MHCSPDGLSAFVPAVEFAAHYDRTSPGTAVGVTRGELTPLTKFLAKIVAWITSGYPEGVPGPDRVPLLALLKRSLSDDEVAAVVRKLLERGEFDHVDIGVLITQITDELPQPEDIERVRARLATKGWPLDDPRDAEEAE